MTIEHWSQIAQIVGALFSIIIGLSTVAVLFFTLKFNKQSKQADTIYEYNSRFSRICEMKANEHIIKNPILFFERFWSLQFDQFNSWRIGLVPKDNFKYWAASRHQEWLRNEKFGEISYQDGYRQTVENWKNSEFHAFIEKLFKDGPEETLIEYPSHK